MGPPSDLPARQFVRHALQFSSEDLEKASETTQETNRDVIAERTRSKHPLTTTSLYDIEEAFVAPDITPDMYDTHCDDSDWQEFLRGLHKYTASQDVQNESAEIVDDEQNDPEFNYLAEAETEELEKDDFRFDKPFRIPRKELNELIDELDELFNDEDRTLIGLRTNLATVQENVALIASKKTGQTREIAPRVQLEHISITEDQVLQIQEQMRKHVQLTCQMYVLACGRQEYSKIADTCIMLLGELDFFRSVSSAADKSSYNVCNLSQAVTITKQDIDWVAARKK
ncbi:GON-4-like protein [Pomacea canaliculata]|uniref:GON-4-like protein n=1 Tax=Pomacea canaliculata TaxID=400727 RepID=UPI000D731CD5|nr:GON-4-like protein [Pomacea canaliculata]